MRFRNVFHRSFSLSSWWEATLQIASKRLMPNAPCVLPLSHFLDQSPTRNDRIESFNFAKISFDVTEEAVYRPLSEIGEVVLESNGKIFIAEELLCDPAAVISTIAHFAAAKHVAGQFDNFNREEQTQYASILSVVGGFGAVHEECIEGSFWSAPIQVIWDKWWLQRPGRLPKAKIAYLLALVARRQESVRSDSNYTWKSELSRSMGKLIQATDEHFLANPPKLFDQQFDPLKDCDPNEISSMLTASDVEIHGAIQWIIEHRVKNGEWADAISVYLQSDCEDSVAVAVQAIAVSIEDKQRGMELIRPLLTHSSQTVAYCAYASLVHLGDDTEFLKKVRIQMERNGIPV